MNDNLAAHLQTLRTRVESEIKRHSVILVTSATSEDGTRLTSFGLAEALAAAGRQTALVDVITNPAEAVEGRFKTAGRRDFPIYALPRDGSATQRSRETIEKFVLQTREAFDYTIVEGPPFGRQNLSFTLATMADAVLIALRMGRQPQKADELLVRSLGSAGAHVFGVVGAEPESIAHFDELGIADYVAEPRPRVAPAPGEIIFPHIRIRQAK